MDESGSLEDERWRRSLVLGAICAALGVALGLLFSHDAVGDGWDAFALYAGAAAGLTSTLLWWFFMERRQRFRVRRGAVIGAIGGLLAHYPCWYFAILGQNITYWLLGGSGSSLGEAPIDPLNGLWAAFAPSFWSWLLLGWLTAIVGGMVGGLYAWRVGRTNSSAW